MNIRRGLFRLWLLGSVAFAITVAFVSYDRIGREFQSARAPEIAKELGGSLLVPADCSQARGTVGTDYSMNDDGRCWYELQVFRKHFPEYRDVRDEELSNRLYEKAGIEVTRAQPWMRVGEAVALALGAPVAVLIAGMALGWALAGFKKT